MGITTYVQGDDGFEEQVYSLFSSLPVMPLVRGWWDMARRQNAEIVEVPLLLEVTDKGLAYFRPSVGDSFPVQCPNFFHHSGVNNQTFGMGVTLCWLQQMHIELYKAGHTNTAEIARKMHSRLKNSAFADKVVWPGIDMSILFDFID
jgi:hypothetical protein